MNYVQSPHFENIPSARARIAALRKGRQSDLTHLQNMSNARSGQADFHTALIARYEDQILLLDVADILLDAMKHGPDNPIIRDIPGRSQMQVPDTLQGPPDLPVDRTERFTVGQAVCITAVPPSHRTHFSQDMHGLIGRGATIVEVEAWQDWMTEPWYRLRCPHGADIGPGHSEGSLPQHCLNRVAEGS